MENNELNSLFDEGKVEKIEHNKNEVQITISQETSSYMIANGFRIEDDGKAFFKIIFTQCDKYDEVKDEGEYGYIKRAYCLENEVRLVCENLILSFSFSSYKIKKIYTLGE
ncbi:MAG: hypothetical protein ACI4U5_03900 [Bacilli bacterium]